MTHVKKHQRTHTQKQINYKAILITLILTFLFLNCRAVGVLQSGNNPGRRGSVSVAMPLCEDTVRRSTLNPSSVWQRRSR